MNPHAAQPTSPAALGKSLWRNRQLILQMTRREVLGRYKGSFMGLAWSFFTPLLMLAVYTFIFSVVFKARWGDGGEESNTGFAVVMFVGMIVHGLFAEALNRAPGMILSNVNYVKKVVFPLEILPVIAMCASLFHTAISLGVLLAAYAAVQGLHPLDGDLHPLRAVPAGPAQPRPGLDAGVARRIPARCRANHRLAYHRHDVPGARSSTP
jgi:lipopolysaccharide transport system permease protein